MSENEKSFYEFTATSLKGEEVDFNTFRGKVVLVVNTASKCGFTPQYAGLEELYKAYGDKGLVVLGFPCNQFASQEPGDADSISQCLIHYGVSFPIFAKIEVNGNNAHPLFVWLKDKLPGLGKAVKWNFTKFLIGKDGTPLERFAPTTEPAKLRGAIEKALAA